MRALPPFDLAGYRALVEALVAAGFATAPASSLVERPSRPTLYLRHDVDLFPRPALEFAMLEASLGVVATYYFMVTGPYNPAHGDHPALLREVVNLGHEVGLHYDLAGYPPHPDAARRQLDREADVLGHLAGAPVRTITTHAPSLSGEDALRASDDYVHPHDPRAVEPLAYVSDSCRAWRDETLLTWVSAELPLRAMLLTHPELWLEGSVEDRMSYLFNVLAPAATRPLRDYLRSEVAPVWLSHEGALAHDAREAAARRG